MRIPAKIWNKKRLPKSVLAIRLQAMGDTVITLPYLNDLRAQLPQEVRLDLLTRREVDAIPRALHLFNRVYSIGGKRSFKRQVVYMIFLLPVLFCRRYDVVIDLQNNFISRMVRILLFPAAWSSFDKYSASAAGERTRATIEACGLGKIYFNPAYRFKKAALIEPLLRRNGWDGKSVLVLLNPAGAFVTRNWPIDFYSQFAHLWLADHPGSQFVITGLGNLGQKAADLKVALGTKLIDLVDKCTVLEAFMVVQKSSLMLSEDSGLMHMSWVSDRPTVLLLGSTRSDWVMPQNKNSLVLTSDDLACGNCMQAVCPLGTLHCLHRYTPEFVFNKVAAFIEAHRLLLTYPKIVTDAD